MEDHYLFFLQNKNVKSNEIEEKKKENCMKVVEIKCERSHSNGNEGTCNEEYCLRNKSVALTMIATYFERTNEK